MNVSEFFFMLLFNGLPVICLAIPIPFMFKKTIGKLYIRFYLGILIFFLVYWILPIIFQTDVEPKQILMSTEDEGNELLGFSLIFVHMFSLIAYFFEYPFATLTFIFVLGPIISFLFLRRKLRKEPGTMEEKLTEVTYELKASPSDMIKERLNNPSWTEEKELLKMLIILLPISLYLLSVLIELLGLESFSITTGTTTMGWFVEILFVYLATFLFGIHLLFSSKLSYKGNYVGENLKENTSRALSQVGIPISALSILLFIAKPTTNPVFIFYFFTYFIMGSIIFILFLDIIEPISIIMLIKFIDWWKSAKKKFNQINWTNFYIPLITALGVSLIIALSYIFFFNEITLFVAVSQSNWSTLIEKSAISYTGEIYLQDALRIDLVNIISTIVFIISLILMAYLFAKSMQFIKRITITAFLYIGTLIMLSIIFILLNLFPPIYFSPPEYWITGSPAYFTLFNQNFYTIRTVLFDINLSATGNLPLLEILAAPYIYTRYVFNILIWGLIFYYYNKKFIAKNIAKGEDLIQRIAFSKIIDFPKYTDYFTDQYRYLVSKSEEGAFDRESVEKREEVINLIDKLTVSQFIKDLKPEDKDERRRFYYTLKYLFYKDAITIWVPEFSYEYERAELQGLYIMYSDGRDVFSYNFLNVEHADPALISGMFSAISAFIKETTQSSQLLRNIDHGDITIQIEYGKWVFSALFIKGKQSLETRSMLRSFVDWFEEAHAEVLVDWNGATHPFKNDNEKVLDIFKEE